MMVKFIETKYVHADAAHFKSVVQSLTGKDSAAAAGQSPVAMGADGVRHRQIGCVATRVNLTGGNRSGLTGYRSNRSGPVPVPAGTQSDKIQNLNLNSKNEKFSKKF